MLSPRTLLFLSSTAVFLFVADRITKALSRSLPADGIFAIPGIVGFRPEQNVGVAFSLDLRPVPLTALVGVLLIVLLILFGRNVVRGDARASWALMLIIIGAFSNFLDRIERGTVTDFIVLSVWPTFNLADAAIVAGAILLAITTLRSTKRHGSSPPFPA